MGNVGRVETKIRVMRKEATELTSGDKCPISGHGVRRIKVNVKTSREM